MSSPQNGSTIDCGVSIIVLVWLIFLPNLNTPNKFYTDVKIDEDPQSFEYPRKKITASLDYVIWILQRPRFSSNTIHIKDNRVLQLQQHHWQSLHLGNIFYVFKLMTELLVPPFVPNQVHLLNLLRILFPLGHLNINVHCQRVNTIITTK